MNTFPFHQYPIPEHYDPTSVEKVWRVPYEQRAREAFSFARQHGIAPAAQDQFRIGLVLIDVQNTFCLPEFELYVAGRSGTGAVEDNRRLCDFLYRNLGTISEITATLDTHQAIQIFHAIYLVDPEGRHPDPLTLVSAEDIEAGRWRFNTAIAPGLGIDPEYGQEQLSDYVRRLAAAGKFDLTIWPYHAMLGGIGHALVSAVEEAVFFHTIARYSRVDWIIKGNNPFTEHYSAVGPEVLHGPLGEKLGSRTDRFLRKVQEFDAVIVAGQAKSHCVAWTVEDLLKDIQAVNPQLAQKVYLLEDCCSPVVVPGVVDFSESADQAFERFAEAGMHIVRSNVPIERWPGIPAAAAA